jgi:tripartite-type tricarboxylate transporter receptor subunit TctC
MLTRRTLLAAMCAAAMLMNAASGWTQTYPSRPVTLIVPFPAGGPADAIGRTIAEGMRAPLSSPVIVENVGGASGNIGTGRAARAAPDGYTLTLGSWPTHVINGAAYTLQYDVLNDFEPITLLTTQPLLIIGRTSLPAKTLPELIDWLKAHPDKATQGTAGRGGASHVAGIFFQRETGTRFQFVPYRGTAINDLIAGSIDFMIDLAASSLPQARSGTVKAFAVTADSRLARAPDIPTVAELGLPGLRMTSWYGLWAPKGTPKPVVARLNAALVDVLADPKVAARLTALGQNIFRVDQQTPEALRSHHQAEIDRWWPILKGANVKGD